MFKIKNIISLNSLFTVLTVLILVSCGSSKPSVSKSNFEKTTSSNYKGGDGLSIENAVILKAKNSMEGIPKEYEYIESKHGKRSVGWKFIKQSLNQKGNKSYDVITIVVTKNNKELEYYFDITDFFGKF